MCSLVWGTQLIPVGVFCIQTTRRICQSRRINQVNYQAQLALHETPQPAIMETVSTIPSVYPTGTCSTCREITLDSLVGVFKAPDFDWQWLNLVYPQIELTSQECAVCGIVIQLLENRGDNVGGAVMVSLSTHTGQMNTSSQDNIMEVRVRHAAGNGFTTRPGWAHFRMYADAGKSVPELNNYNQRADLANIID